MTSRVAGAACALLAVAVGLPGRVLAEDSQPEADVEAGPLYQTTVVASGRDEKVFESARSVEVVGRAELDRQQARTTPEALLEQPGVFLQRTNYGGGMPIIRGQHGNRVLLLVDGIRINNSTTRSGPNQFLNTVDSTLADRIEVLRGTGSALHGSDALGGAINVITESPQVGGAGRLTGNAGLRGATFDRSGGLAGRLRWSGQRLGVTASGSVRHFGDLRGGADTGLQPFNGYDEWSAGGGMAVAVGDASKLSATVQTTQQRDVLRTFGSTPADFRLFTRQARTLGYLRHEVRDLGPVDQLRATVSYHYQDEQFDRYRITRNAHLREDTTIGTVGVQLEGTIRHATRGDLTAGAELYLDDVTAKGAAGQIAGVEPTFEPQLGRYAPGAGYATAAVFANHTLPLGERLRLTGELRAGAVRVSLPHDERLVLLFPAEQLTALEAHSEVVPVYAGGLFARYLLAPNLAAFGGASLGFRAPNLDDYSRLGVEGTGYIAPTRGLKPERALSGEVGLKAAAAEAELSVAYSYTYIFDAMTRVPSAIGSVTMLDGMPVIRVSNGESARYHSFELGGRLPLWRKLTLTGNSTITRANQRRRADGAAEMFIDEPAPKVPPAFGMVALGWRSRWSLEGVIRYALAQARLAEADRIDTRICPDAPGRCEGTEGWTTFGIRASAAVLPALRLAVAFENLTNASYRMHASGIDGPGRGVVATLEGVLP